MSCLKNPTVPAAFSIAFLAFLAPHPAVRAQVPEPPESIVLQFPNNPISDVLAVYEKLTGKSVIKDSEIFEGSTLSLVTPGEVSREDAIRLIESTLRLNDYALAYDVTQNTVRVMPEDTNQADVNVGLPVYDSPQDIPENETLIGYFMRLEYLDPIEAGSIFFNHAGLNRFGRITPVLNPSGLLITETASMVRQLVRLREVVDVPHQKTNLITEFVQLEYAEAAIVSQIIQATLASRPDPPRIGEATFSSGGSLNSQRSSEDERLPQVVADDRLNRIMIVAMPGDFAYIKSLIDEWDRPIDPSQSLERPLKYLYVDEALPVLVDILQDTGVGTAPLPGGGSITTRQPPQASTTASTLTGRLRRGVQVRDTQGGTVQGSPDRLVEPLDNTAPISVSVGKTRIVADLQANSIIAMGPKESLRKISDLLDKLDQKPPQVYLATVIGQLTLGNDMQFGVEYLQRFREAGDNPILSGGSGSLIDRELLRLAIDDARTNLLTRGVPVARGLNLYGQLGESLDVFITALEETNRFQVLSRPSIYAANNKKAVITSGRRIPVPTSTVTDIDNSDASNVITNIDFQDVVLKLEVVPLINSNKEVTLTMAQVNDTEVGVQRVAGEDVPIIGTEELTTTVTIPNRHTVVLGGLITESEQNVDRGVPFISRIPVVGHAFKTTTRQKERKELIIFIQPMVVEDDASLLHGSYQEDLRTQVGEEAARAFPESPPAVPEQAMPATSRAVPAEPLPAPVDDDEDSGALGGFFSRFRSPSR